MPCSSWAAPSQGLYRVGLLKPDHSLPLQGSSNKSSLPLGWLRCCSVQFSRSVMSDSLRPYGLQRARLPCPSPTHWACSNSCPSNWWCHPTISSSVVPFSSCFQSCPASGSFQMSHLFVLGGQSIGVLASNQSFQWTPRTDLLQDGLFRSPCCPRDSHESSPTPQFKSINSWHLAFFIVLLSHSYMATGKTIALTRQTFVGKVLLFNMLSRLVIVFLPRSKRLLISWLQSPSAVILEPQKIKSDTVSTVSPSVCHDLCFLNVEF